MNPYTIEKMALLLGITKDAVQKRVKKLGVMHRGKIGNQHVYSTSDFLAIKFNKYLYTTLSILNDCQIYESKINNRIRTYGTHYFNYRKA